MTSTTIATWNVNSVRARLEGLLSWLSQRRPDVCCLQETRCGDHQFPFGELSEIGYEVAHHGDGGRNGVAICSLVGLDSVERGFWGHQSGLYTEPRLIAATCAGIRVHSVYVPNGRALDDPHYLFKLVWLERLRGQLERGLHSGQRAFVAGDFNVAPTDLDIYDPARWRRRTHASPPEREAIRALEELGLVDLARSMYPVDAMYTWWNYRSGLDRDQGLRIDLAFATPDLAAAVTRVFVDRAVRAAERPSDHAPLCVELAAGDRS